MKSRPAPLAAALVGGIALAATTHCSLLAPSDQELMGGNQSADAGDGGGDGSSNDGSSLADGASTGDDAGPCLQETFGCGGQTPCCSGLTCDSVALICLPSGGGACSPRGGACPGGSSVECCSQVCVNHVCK